MDEDRIRTRWQAVVTAAWALAAITSAVAVWLIVRHGIVETPAGTLYNWTVWAAGIGQTIGAVLLALLFTMVNEIHKTTTDIFYQNQRALRRRD